MQARGRKILDFGGLVLVVPNQGLAGGAKKIIGGVYPNPASELVRITGSSPLDTTLQLRLFDPSGKVVYQGLQHTEAGAFAWEVPVAQLSAGVYIVQLTNSTGTTSQKLVIK